MAREIAERCRESEMQKREGARRREGKTVITSSSSGVRTLLVCNTLSRLSISYRFKSLENPKRRGSVMVMEKKIIVAPNKFYYVLSSISPVLCSRSSSVMFCRITHNPHCLPLLSHLPFFFFCSVLLCHSNSSLELYCFAFFKISSILIQIMFYVKYFAIWESFSKMRFTKNIIISVMSYE